MRYKLNFANDFNEDLREIFLYISRKLCNKQAAQRLMTNIRESCERLTEFPYSCPACEGERGETGYRKLSVGNFIAIYEVDEETKTVNMLNCVYARSDYQNKI